MNDVETVRLLVKKHRWAADEVMCNCLRRRLPPPLAPV